MSAAETLTVLEAAEELGFDPADVYGLVFSKALGFSQAPNGRILIPRAALDEYLRNAAVRPHSSA